MRPRLIHPVEIVVSQVTPGAQTLDATFEEPIGTPTRANVTLRGQIKTGRNQALAMTAGGASPIANSDGHVVFEIDALAAAGVTLHVGDVIVSVAGRAVRHRVTHLDDHATYAGRHWHRWAYFEDEDRA